MLLHFAPLDKISVNSENLYEFISLSQCLEQCISHYVLCLDFHKLSATRVLLESQSKGWGRVILLLTLHIVPSSQSGARADIYIYISWKKV